VSRSPIKNLVSPWRRYTLSKNNFAYYRELTVELHGIKWAIFERVHTTVRIASYPSTLGRLVIKSIETESQGLDGTSKGIDDP